MAGNVPLFTPPGTHAAIVAGCARHVATGGALVAGFQLGRGYALDEYDAHCAAAGLTPRRALRHLGPGAVRRRRRLRRLGSFLRSCSLRPTIRRPRALAAPPGFVSIGYDIS